MPASDFIVPRGEVIDLLGRTAHVQSLPDEPLDRALALADLLAAASDIRAILDDLGAELSARLDATGVATKPCTDCGVRFVVPAVGRPPNCCPRHRRRT